MRRCHRVLGLVLCCRDTEDETNIMINDTESRSYKETPHHKTKRARIQDLQRTSERLLISLLLIPIN